jgi:hypothetical protein
VPILSLVLFDPREGTTFVSTLGSICKLDDTPQLSRTDVHCQRQYSSFQQWLTKSYSKSFQNMAFDCFQHMTQMSQTFTREDQPLNSNVLKSDVSPMKHVRQSNTLDKCQDTCQECSCCQRKLAELQARVAKLESLFSINLFE